MEINRLWIFVERCKPVSSKVLSIVNLLIYGFQVFSAECERLESNLSILLLGTKYGEIHIYAGAGLLFTVTLKLSSPYPCHVLDIETPPDFSSVQVVASNQCESEHGNILSLYYFDCSEYALHGDVLGVFAAKAISYKRYLSVIHGEMSGLHENWGKIVDVYNYYLSYGTGKASETVKADYADLLMTGVSSPELEMFLGSGGREKEAKKFINALQTAAGGFNDSVKNIKSNIIYLLRELTDITGFHRYAQVSTDSTPSVSGGGVADGLAIIGKLKQLMSVLYHGVLHAQLTVNTFLRSFLHFITMVINTAHTFHVIENSEMSEEDADPERVFELLRFKVMINIFQMLELHPPEHPRAVKKTWVPEAVTSPTKELTENKLSFLDEVVPPMTEAELEQFYKGPSIIDIAELKGDDPGSSPEWTSLWKVFKEKGLPIKPSLINLHNSQIHGMLISFPQLANEQLRSLLTVPLLPSGVPSSNLVLNCFENGNLEADRCGIVIDPASERTFVYHKEGLTNGNRVWLYQVDHLGSTNGDGTSSTSNPTVTAALLSFTQQVQAADFLDSSVLSVLCYAPQPQPTTRRRPSHLDEDEEYEPFEIPGNSSVCHIYIQEILENLPSRPLRLPKSTTVLSNKWTEVDIAVPTDVPGPGPIEHEHIAQILPIGSFHPTLMALSGARRVGAILDTTKKIIQLLDMDLESSENSSDLDTTTGSTASTVTEDVRDLAIE